MSIGATLASARRRSGLTVSEVSHSTRVTEPIIRGIEQDDYAACGGDFYARGHIRAIARAVGEDPSPLIDEFDSTWRSAKEITAAEAFQPAPAAAQARAAASALDGFPGRARASGPRLRRLQVRLGDRPGTARIGRRQPASLRACPDQPAVGQQSSRPGRRGPGVPGHHALGKHHSVGKSRSDPDLAPASVAAFGPAGPADGDNPQLAALAVGRNPATPWYSQWYATPGFGDLKAGTGLLLDMGRTVTVSSVRLLLVSHSGADLALRAGSKPVLSLLPQVASASNAGSTVHFQLGAPAHVRYVLIWFTKLPPDTAGTYQASVYKIIVQGQP